VPQEHLARLGILAQLVDVEVVVASPIALDPLGQPESLSGGFDRRLQHLSKRHAPEAIEKAAPAVHDAGYRHAEHAVERHVVESPAVIELRRRRCRRRSPRSAVMLADGLGVFLVGMPNGFGETSPVPAIAADTTTTAITATPMAGRPSRRVTPLRTTTTHPLLLAVRRTSLERLNP